MAAESEACARAITKQLQQRMNANGSEAAECIRMIRKLGAPVESLQVRSPCGPQPWNTVPSCQPLEPAGSPQCGHMSVMMSQVAVEVVHACRCALRMTLDLDSPQAEMSCACEQHVGLLRAAMIKENWYRKTRVKNERGSLKSLKLCGKLLDLALPHAART